MLESELDLAISLARIAGISILEHYSTDFVTEEKFGLDNQSEPVTIADRDASRIIVDGLRLRFPNDGILSEEETDDSSHRISKKRAWIIDPIDGTWGFVKKDGDFAVQIGLAEAGKPVLGVVFMPFYERLYFATKGGGAFLVDKDAAAVQLHVSELKDFSQMGIATSRNHRNPRMALINQEFGIGRELRRGSIGLKVGLIAEQECDLYINLSPRSKFWDTCGPQIILEEAGGKLTDLYGEEYRYDQVDVTNHNGVVATNGVSHEIVLERLRPLLNEFGRLKIKSASES